MDGIQSAKIIRQWQLEGKFDNELKLVLATGEESFDQKQANEKDLFDFVLQKPIEIAKMKSMLDSVFNI